MPRPKRQDRKIRTAANTDPLSAAVHLRDAQTIQMVRDALRHQEVLMAYQPILRSADQHQVAFYEGLIRVLDETGRVIPARDFVPLVEETELGRMLDTLALRMGTTALRHHPGLRLSINMSARSIGTKSWRKTLDRALSGDPTIGERLILEISEHSAMLLPELVIDFMAEMQRKGVCFAMDNFGGGAFTIRHFKDFLFDILKIDGQFIQGLADDADNQVVTGALVSVARQFDLVTVAQNVERAQDAAAAQTLGVDCLQGFYFSAPTTQPDWSKTAAARKTG